MGWVLTIDFGTVNTAAAWSRDGRIEKVVLEPGSDTMPSAVVLTGSVWRVGQAAMNARRGSPQTFVASPKARLGQEPVLFGDQQVTAAELVSHVLSVVRERSMRAVDGTPPDQLVLTHPEHWGPTRLAALHEAARLAGFSEEQIVLLPEPVAAVHGHIVPTMLPTGSRMAVVDVGGGTCDVAVVETTPDGLVVVARAGDERLGGNDLDALLYRWVSDQLVLGDRDDILEMLDDPKNLGLALTLMDVVRGAKHDLSEHPDAPVAVVGGPGHEVTLTITRAVYEELVAEPIGRAAALVADTLASSGTTTLAHLFLAGGTAYTPALARALEPVTGIAAAPYGNPKLVTAIGALRACAGPHPPLPGGAPAPVAALAGAPDAGADGAAEQVRPAPDADPTLDMAGTQVAPGDLAPTLPVAGPAEPKAHEQPAPPPAPPAGLGPQTPPAVPLTEPAPPPPPSPAPPAQAVPAPPPQPTLVAPMPPQVPVTGQYPQAGPATAQVPAMAPGVVLLPAGAWGPPPPEKSQVAVPVLLSVLVVIVLCIGGLAVWAVSSGYFSADKTATNTDRPSGPGASGGTEGLEGDTCDRPPAARVDQVTPTNGGAAVQVHLTSACGTEGDLIGGQLWIVVSDTYGVLGTVRVNVDPDQEIPLAGIRADLSLSGDTIPANLSRQASQYTAVAYVGAPPAAPPEALYRAALTRQAGLDAPLV
ncbi:MAG: Hsp70 family protein, partial [Micrococcales bacterium]|nr:Hsp70 family protein [Micrococcales bacterium]